ncbi:MAG TPA: HlyD family secretion protein [Casimicrobiaceae bacterium]
MSEASPDPAGEAVAKDVAAQPAPRRRMRQRLRLPLLLLAPIVLLIGGAWLYLTGGRYQSTDNAYVRAARVAISSNIAGRVTEVAVHDNQLVHRGDVLFRLDDAPLRIAVQEAQAQLATARLQVESLKASYRQRQADLRSAQDTAAYQQREYERQEKLLAPGIASQAQVDRARHEQDSARQQVAGVQQQMASILANLGGSINLPIDRHPSVQQASALLERARLNLSYAVIAAPDGGIVTKVEQVQVGSYINAAAPVFALVSTHDVWVEANFKEVQLTHMREGQTATVEIDTYPNKSFTARVASLSPGTGSEFSVLPPENATGNWIKVIQRVPVRLELQDSSADAPLRAGLSASVTVDTQYRHRLFGKDGLLSASTAAR